MRDDQYKLIVDGARRAGAKFPTQDAWLDFKAAIDRACGVLPTPSFGAAEAIKPTQRKLADPGAFYTAVRRITKKLDQTQVSTIESLLAGASHWPIGWVAYGLATAWHEARLRPIHELGGKAYLSKYDTGKLAKALGNTPEADGDGIKYAGRGLVQLTGLANYRRASDELGLALVDNPDLALKPDVAVRILIWGMEGGKFTTKKLATYLPNTEGTLEQFIEARRIINGMDRAHLIAGYALAFQNALKAGGWS